MQAQHPVQLQYLPFQLLIEATDLPSGFPVEGAFTKANIFPENETHTRH